MIYFMYRRVGNKSFRKKGGSPPYTPDLGQADFRIEGRNGSSMTGDKWETL